MDRMYKACAIVAGTLLTTAATADVVKVADSITEFSGVQGQDSWSYGWYAGDDVALSGGVGSLDTGDFKMFEHYAPAGWWTHDAASADAGLGATPFFLTVITADLMHSNAPVAGSTDVASEIRWASRRWTSEVDGNVTIDGSVSKYNYGGALGDGTEAYILLDGAVVYHYDVANDDFEGTSFSFDLNVLAGSQIELVLGANDDGLFDATAFAAEITGEVVPAPGVIALLGMGGLLAGRRRR